jgi:predicted nicotinamide N-methyase
METNPSEFEPSKLANKKVLELGSGCGLAGLAYMLRGASVTLTDLHKVTSSLTTRNAQTNYQNALSSGANSSVILQRPVVYAIDWTEHASNTVINAEGERETLIPEVYDIILLTDCVFSVELVPDLMATILKHVGPKTTVMVCHEVRDEVSCDCTVCC